MVRQDVFRYVCLCVLVMASGRVMAVEARGLRPAGRKDPKVETTKMLGKQIKRFCGYEFGSPMKKGFDPEPQLVKPKSRYRKFTDCALMYEQDSGLYKIVASARLGKVKAEALAVMKDFTTKYGAVFEKGEPSDTEAFQIVGRIPFFSSTVSFADILISGHCWHGRGALTVDITARWLKGKISSKLTDAEIEEIRKDLIEQEQFKRESERKKELEEEKKKREEEEVLKKMKACDVSKFETEQSRSIIDFIDFARRESGNAFYFVLDFSKLGERPPPTVDFSVKGMTLFDVLEKMAKDGKGTYQVSRSSLILKFP